MSARTDPLTPTVTDDLPIWMRRALRHTDWGALLIIAFSVIAAWSFIVQSELPNASQLEHYLFRTADYAQSLREGVLYPRWSAHVLGGYGAPIPHFYPPLPAYLPAAITVFLTNDPITAVRIVVMITFLVAGATTYTLVARRSGAGFGLIAGALFLFSPVVGSVAPAVIGDLPQVLFHALLPLALWSIDGILLLNRKRDRLIAASAIAGLMLTDVRFAAASVVIALILTLWHVVSTGQTRRLWLVLLSITIGIGLATSYWLPVLTEWDQVTWRYLGVQSPIMLDLSALISAYLPLDPNEVAPNPQLTLGIVLIAFSAAALVYVLWRRKTLRIWRNFQYLWLVMGIITSAVALILLPTQIWLLSVITLCFSIGGSQALNWRELLPHASSNVILPAALITLLAGTTSVWLVPEWRVSTKDFSPAAQVEYEQQGYGIAVLPDDAPLPMPNFVVVTPQLNPALINGYRTREVNRISPQAGRRVQIGTIATNNQGYNLQIRALDPLTLDVLTTYYEGWTAISSSLPVELIPNLTNGLITIDIRDAGTGEIRVQFETTPIRTSAWLVTWLSVGTLLLFGFNRNKTLNAEPRDDFQLLTPAEVRLTTLILVGSVFVITLIATPLSPLRISARPGYKLDNAFALRARTDVGLESLAYQISRAEYRPGETVEFTVYWRTLRFLEQNYQVRASLISRATGARWQSVPLRHLGDYPTRRWITSLYVTDTYTIPLLPGTPHGEYSLSLELFDCTINCTAINRLSFFDTSGQSLGSQLILPVVLTITP